MNFSGSPLQRSRRIRYSILYITANQLHVACQNAEAVLAKKALMSESRNRGDFVLFASAVVLPSPGAVFGLKEWIGFQSSPAWR